jgi:predicted alternative tryptophan synthase beta-subunit
MPYSFEACSIDGKAIMSQSGIASALDLNRFNLKNGVYLVRVKTMEKTYSSKVMMSR